MGFFEIISPSITIKMEFHGFSPKSRSWFRTIFFRGMKKIPVMLLIWVRTTLINAIKNLFDFKKKLCYNIYIKLRNKKIMACWSSGQDAGFSDQKQGFDSLTSHLANRGWRLKTTARDVKRSPNWRSGKNLSENEKIQNEESKNSPSAKSESQNYLKMKLVRFKNFEDKKSFLIFYKNYDIIIIES